MCIDAKIIKMNGPTDSNKIHMSTAKKMELKRDRMGWCGVDWIDLAQDRDQWTALVNMIMNLRVP
jgi:hypothetical protein